MVTFNKSIAFAPRRECVKEFIAEFLGTFLLVFMGNNSVAESVLSNGQAGNSVTVYVGYAGGLFLGILVAAGVSGAHLNPAVTLAGAVVKRFEWSKVPHYMLGQYAGAFVAACLTYLLYMDSFDAFHSANGISRSTAGIFATYPTAGLTVFGSILDQFLGTLILVMSIYAVTDKYNTQVPVYLVSTYITLVLLTIGCSMGMNQGFAVNPARDLAPRFFTFLTYWGNDVFANDTHWYATIIGPHIGAICGAFMYIWFVEKMEVDDELDDSNARHISIEKKTSTVDPPPLCTSTLKREGQGEKREVYTCYL